MTNLSKEIITELISKYNKKEKINESFESYVMKRTNNNVDIYKEVIGLIPEELYVDPLNEYALLDYESFKERYKKIKS